MSKNYLESWLEDDENKLAFAQEELLINVHDAIWECIKEQNISNAILAEKLGKSRPYITKALKPGNNITLKTLAELCYALDVSPHIELVRNKNIHWDLYEHEKNTSTKHFSEAVLVMNVSPQPNQWHDHDNIVQFRRASGY